MINASPARFMLFGAAGFGLGGPLAWSVGYFSLIELSTPLVDLLEDGWRERFCEG